VGQGGQAGFGEGVGWVHEGSRLAGQGWQGGLSCSGMDQLSADYAKGRELKTRCPRYR
jgi:hypothetical protein